MKLKSSIQIKSSFNIDEQLGETNKVTFIDLSSEKKEETTHEEETITEYVYDAYRIALAKDVDIENNYDVLLKQAKEYEIEKLSEEIRQKRNELLKDSDKEMAFDRLGLELPTEITMTNIISVLKKFAQALTFVMSGDWAKYRQELRDITKQECFPYDVTFPDIPTSEISGEE